MSLTYNIVSEPEILIFKYAKNAVDSLQVTDNSCSIHCNYIGHCPLSDVYLMYIPPQELPVTPIL